MLTRFSVLLRLKPPNLCALGSTHPIQLTLTFCNGELLGFKLTIEHNRKLALASGARFINPRGKPEGSNGGTKEMPERIDRKIKAKVRKRCEKCNGKLKIKKYFRIFYELEINIFTTEAEVEEGYCEHCDITYTGSHPDLPKEGMIGPNFLALITELKHNFAGSHSKISTFLENLTDFSLSHTAINDCVKRVSDSLKPSYNIIKEETQKSSFSHSDETSWPVDGKKWWLWLFITANTVLIMIKNSRARRVLIDLFGECYNGTIISDCLKVYQKFAAAFQKDLGHL